MRPLSAQTGLPAGNSELPINLEAASSDFDYKNNTLLFKRVKITQGGLEVTAQQASATGLEFNNSEWRLQGDVKITVPGGKLQSSEARVMFKDNAIASASIKGSPAQFEQRLKEKNQVARGRARLDRLRRQGRHRAPDGRCLAHRRQQRDSRQHADLRHRP